MGRTMLHELLNPHTALENPHTLVMSAIPKFKLRCLDPDSHLIQIVCLLTSSLHPYPPEEIKLQVVPEIQLSNSPIAGTKHISPVG